MRERHGGPNRRIAGDDCRSRRFASVDFRCLAPQRLNKRRRHRIYSRCHRTRGGKGGWLRWTANSRPNDQDVLAAAFEFSEPASTLAAPMGDIEVPNCLSSTEKSEAIRLRYGDIAAIDRDLVEIDRG